MPARTTLNTNSNLESFKGAAIVTGAAQGIGKAVAIRLAKDGYDVAVNDIPGKEDALQAVAKEIVRSTGQKSIILPVDITDEEGVIGMIKQTVEELGTLRVMIANAGISLTFGTECLDLQVEDFDKVLKVNLIGTFLCYREAARQMIKQDSWGRIIGASSVMGKKGVPRSTGYAASKFGVVGITQCLASEMARLGLGITVNAYAPGLIDTPMARGDSSESETDLTDEELTKKLSEDVGALNLKVPRGYPGDIAGAVSYLASEESKFMTGQTLSIDGGLHFG